MNEQEFQAALRFARAHATRHFNFSAPRVQIGQAAELTPAEHQELTGYLTGFAPWRKGPFEIFGQMIDANWRSDRKWERALACADPLRDRRVCDVGTGNGYYLFRMAAESPADVLGLDPTEDFARCFEFLNAFVAHVTPQIRFLPAGFDALEAEQYSSAFDVIFCMGVVYHHTDPIRLLRIIHSALRPGGQLVLESLGLPSGYCADPIALTPERGRYAGGGGNWFVPNAAGLLQWLRRSGFRDAELVAETDFMDEQVREGDLPGLRDFLDPENPARTTEGYPAPVRLLCTARR